MPFVLAFLLGGRGEQFAVMPRAQSGTIVNLSPITPVDAGTALFIPPFSDMPGLTIPPFDRFVSVWQSVPVHHVVVAGLIGLSGSQFGTIHGFTQRGCTGVMVPEVPTLAELDELKTSALAVALT
jgi:hypothetical protein